MLKRLLREPLVHFAGLALAIFAFEAVASDGPSADDTVIAVSSADQQRLAAIWTATTGRAPSPDDRKALIAQYVEEAALAREAERLGLAEGDEIIRRRLAQKMRFFVEAQTMAEPTEAQLDEWFAANQQRFATGGSRDFVHVYFSPERRGAEIERDAAAARKQLVGGADWQQLGDPFLQQRRFRDADRATIERDFGREFADAVFALPSGEWSAPIGSALGLHIVRVSRTITGRTPELAAARDRVLAAYREEKQRETQREAIDKIVAQYDIRIADSAD